MSCIVDAVRVHLPPSLRSSQMLEPLGTALAAGDAISAWPHWQALLAQIAPRAAPALIRAQYTDINGQARERVEVSALVTDLEVAGQQVLVHGADGDGRVDWPDTTIDGARGGFDIADGWLQLRGQITLAEVAAQRSLLLCCTERVAELDKLLVGAAYRFGFPDADGGIAPSSALTSAVLAARTLAEGTTAFYCTDGWEGESTYAVATTSAPSSPTHHACPLRLGELIAIG